MKLLSAFLKREHGVAPRVFDEAVYAVYHLPLLPGYGQHVNVRSSPAVKSPGGKSIQSKMSEAEEYGYDGTYFAAGSPSQPYSFEGGGYIASSPPNSRKPHRLENGEHVLIRNNSDQWRPGDEDNLAEVVFFDYVWLFSTGSRRGRRGEDDWETEECHYEYDPTAQSPRIYNDFFTFKSSSHLLKLSLAHALAQSTLLAHYESIAQVVLLAPSVMSIPKQLAHSGELVLRRGEALKLTGRLFKLRRDVNLVSNVLDTPELFWSEASLKALYDATRDYFEIEPRVQVLNERLGVASDLLDIIHEHLNNGAMIRITWIIIWLIVVACLVDLGEVLARLVVHVSQSTTKSSPTPVLRMASVHEGTMALDRLMSS
ncbi:Sad1-interacting factor 3 [Ceratobasidium sp. AG-Ba]|nr:Sad1-interacting factor 3 [Ceratobasidium sp. AG-Ba]